MVPSRLLPLMAELANVSQVEELRCYHASHSVVKPTEIGSSHGRVPFLEGIEDIQWLLLTGLMLKENNTILQNCVLGQAIFCSFTTQL